MKISDTSVDRPLLVIMVVSAMIFLGWISLVGLPVDLFPEMDFPLVTVRTLYPGASPSEVEKLVTKPVEEAVSTIADVKKVTSTSIEGVSLVVVEFEWGIDLDIRALDVRDKVAAMKFKLPDDTEEPVVNKFDMMSNEMAISVSITSGEGLFEAREFAEDEVKERLERINGVGAAMIRGGLEREIQVRIDQQKLHAYKISLDDISDVLEKENIDLPGGRVKETEQELTVRTLGEFESVDEISDIIVRYIGGKPVYLHNVAEVVDSYKEIRQYARTNFEPSVQIEVMKKSGGNTVQIADDVKEAIKEINKDFPDYSVRVALDLSTFIEDSINMVKENALYGGILAIIILFIFLRKIKPTLIIAMAIPVAIIVTFALIKARDLTLNLLSLGGLALGVGMMVDNSIVVLESIFRHIRLGKKPIEGAKIGSREVAVAITASTFTTLAVFTPIIFFTTGIVKEVFADLCYTVTFSMAVSLVVALTFVPMACSRLLRRDKTHNPPIPDIDPAPKQQYNKMQQRLTDILEKILPKKFSSIILTVTLFGICVVLLAFVIPKEFFPRFDRGEFAITLELPVGTSLEATNKTMKLIEKKVREIPELVRYTATINPWDNPNEAALNAVLTDKKDRDISSLEVIKRLRKDIKKMRIPGAGISIVEEAGGHGRQAKAVQIIVKGEDREELRRINEKYVQIVRQINGTADVDTSMRQGKPEVKIELDRKALADRGLNASDVAGAIRSYLTGDVATRYREGDDEIDVRIQLIGKDELKREDVRNLLLDLPDGNKIPVDEVANIRIGTGPLILEREDQINVGYVTSNLEGAKLGTVTEWIKKQFGKVSLPSQYRYEFTGEQKDMQEAFQSLTIALVIGIVLIYMILVAQFESFVQPFVIMLTVPIAIVGVVLALLITFQSFSIMVFLGLIVLAGIVVNNAIVLIDYINQLRSRGVERKEAIIEAARIRLRPILLTTLTTVFGMMPLAIGIGSGSEFYKPLAITVIGGLLFSTLLTLIFIPIVYALFDDLAVWLKKNFRIRTIEKS
jgi:hydrophobic/amphiphilic exporter-1 (mainly G- bacteria), HAE1 family